MTRRRLLTALAVPALLHAQKRGRSVAITVNLVIDRRPNFTPGQIRNFLSGIWTEAVRNLARCGVQLKVRRTEREVKRSPGDLPVFEGLDRAALNVIITQEIPMRWGLGRELNGVTLMHEGHHLCVVAMSSAHGNRVPLIALNTCLHELLHAIFLDHLKRQPEGVSRTLAEFRIDRYATGLWLFGQGDTICAAAGVLAERLVRQSQ